jgi:Na+/glutamate symporter
MSIILLSILNCFNYVDCKEIDLTNTAATVIGIIIGSIIGAIISWWIYNRQQETSNEQDKLLKHIEELGIKQERIIEKINTYEENHDKMLNNILTLDKKIDSLLEK